MLCKKELQKGSDSKPQRLISYESRVWLCSADLDKARLILTGSVHGQLVAGLEGPRLGQFICVPHGLIPQQASPVVRSRQGK